MRVVSRTQTSLETPRRPALRVWLAPVAALGMLVGAAFLWSAPREDVSLPGPDATPEQVFTADFDGGDGTVEDGWWGYVLQRGNDGLWHITDAGVV